MEDIKGGETCGKPVRRRIITLVVVLVGLGCLVIAALAMLISRLPGHGSLQNWHPGSDTPPIQVLAHTNNEFACDLHRALVASEGGNLTCSPYSVAVILAMTHAGARGASQGEITRAMYFKLKAPQLYEAFASHNELIDQIDGGTLASSAWVQQNYPLRSEYQELITKTFGSSLEKVDFSQIQDAVDRINNWTAQATQNRIPQILDSEEVDYSTRLVLVNCIDLDMKWKKEFDYRISGLPFTLADGSEAEVSLMKGVFECGYYGDDEYQAIRLDFSAGDPRQIVVLLPAHNDGLDELEARLDAAFIANLNRRIDYTKVDTLLPPFKLDCSFNLIPVLEALGIRRIFNLNADLSGISSGEQLYVDILKQKAIVEVDEQGVKATAVTLAGDPTGWGGSPVVEPETFRADHPFLFIVQDSRTGAILFTGRITDPSGL